MSNPCIHCGQESVEGYLECGMCRSVANDLSPLPKTSDSVIRKYHPVLMRAARALPAKQTDQQAVHELARIGLGERLMRLSDATGCNQGEHQELIKAIAGMRVLVEKLTLLHCDTAERADAFRFYLEQEARAQEPARGAMRNG